MKKVKSLLQQDITHHTILTLAAFGLVVASSVTTLGVATLGVQAQVAFAQNETVAQTAAALMGDDRGMPRQMPAMTNGSSTMPQKIKMEAMASSSPMFCPKIARTIMRGNSDATTTGDIGQLQQFIANHFNVDPKEVVTGYFGSTTQAYLKKFQQEQGIPPAAAVGPLTRAAILKLCGPKPEPKGEKMEGIGSTTRMMGSTTEPRKEHPTPPMPPKPTTAPAPTSYVDNSSNAASVIEALNEIGNGYTKLFQATLSSLGL